VHALELVKEYHKQKPTTVNGIRRLAIESSVNMLQSTSPFTSGYTWDQLHSVTVDLDNCQKEATLEVEAYFFNLTKEHRQLGQPNSIAYKQV
jgi:hypothetical protein